MNKPLSSSRWIKNSRDSDYTAKIHPKLTLFYLELYFQYYHHWLVIVQELGIEKRDLLQKMMANSKRTQKSKPENKRFFLEDYSHIKPKSALLAMLWFVAEKTAQKSRLYLKLEICILRERYNTVVFRHL